MLPTTVRLFEFRARAVVKALREVECSMTYEEYSELKADIRRQVLTKPEHAERFFRFMNNCGIEL
jgi:hypothetical protein